MRYLVLLFVAAFLVLNEPISPVASSGDQVGSLDVAETAPSLLPTSLPTADACCIQPTSVDLASGELLRDFKPADSTSIKTSTTLDMITTSNLGTGEPLRVWYGEIILATPYLPSRHQASTADRLPIYVVGQEAVGRRLS